MDRHKLLKREQAPRTKQQCRAEYGKEVEKQSPSLKPQLLASGAMSNKHVRRPDKSRLTKEQHQRSSSCIYILVGSYGPCYSTSRGVRHERKSRTLWHKSIGNHWKSVGNHGNLARNQKSEIRKSARNHKNNEKHPLFV